VPPAALEEPPPVASTENVASWTRGPGLRRSQSDDACDRHAKALRELGNAAHAGSPKNGRGLATARTLAYRLTPRMDLVHGWDY
jgi:hypothetical protein